MRIIFPAVLMLPFFANAQLQLAKLFSNNMMFQREQPVHIWGKAAPGKNVTVSFAKVIKSVRANTDSSWNIYLAEQKANPHPQTLIIISGTDRIVLKNILIGDIWVCIGQSNMEWPMIKEMHCKAEIAASDLPLLHFYNPTYAGKNIFGTSFTDSVVQLLTKDNFYKGQWQQCDSTTFKTMSAVAYFFGKNVLEEIKVPIGLINLSIGGAPLESFINSEAMKNSKQFSGKLNGDWLTNDALPVWVRERGRQNIGGFRSVPQDEYGNNHAFKPGFAYDAGIAPLFPIAIKGLLNYQGESNAQEIERVNEYAALSEIMVNDYRKKWKQQHLPFYFVQLSSIDTAKYKGHLWPQFRDAQRKMLQLIPHSGMAVCSDIGFKDDVHPTNKKDVGERLARWALNKTYGRHIVPSGPLPLQAKYINGKVLIRFQYMAKGLKTLNGGALKGFSLDGMNEIEAVFGDRAVVIDTDKRPEIIYYGWKPFSEGNLVNSENLPASTFKIKIQ